MTKILYLITLGLIISCSQKNKTTETSDTVDITESTKPKDSTSNANSDSEERDCVFNNDYKGLTETWLTELKITNFIWDKKLEQALIPRGQDTIFISQGGCVHFGILVEIKLTKDNHQLTDSLFFVKKALDLATEFKMDNYERVIKERKFKKVQNTRDRVAYEIEDNNLEDNLFYNGIEITDNGQDKRISLSQYLN